MEPLANCFGNLFFPIFLSITFFLFSGNIRKISMIFLILIFVGIFFTYINQDNLKLIFYSPLFRFWEFLLGTFALFVSRIFTKKSAIYSAISFLLIVMLSFCLLYPMYIRQLPTYVKL